MAIRIKSTFFSESPSSKLDYESSKVSHPLMNEKMMKIHEKTLPKRKNLFQLFMKEKLKNIFMDVIFYYSRN